MEDKKKLVYLILIIIILILVAVNIKVFINNTIGKNGEAKQNEVVNQTINNTKNVTTEEEDNENRKNKIASLNEKLRMQTYFGTYISYIESQEYENAYNLLYDSFKQNYFPTLQDFITYAQQKYPKNMVVNYKDISREGTIYIITVEIRDALNSNKQTEIEDIQVVITENDVNDFKISFEVK